MSNAQAIVTGTDAIAFSGASALTLGRAASGTISGFAPGDTIDLQTVAYKSSYEAAFDDATGSGGTLYIVDTANNNAVLASLPFVGSFAGETFTLTADPAGGSDISLTTSKLVCIGNFTGGNGYNTWGGLTSDAAGDLFGTTYMSGGTVFELVKSGSGYGAPVTVATFAGSIASTPLDGLFSDTAGDLFGTTYAGGNYGQGTVFEVVKSGSGYSAPVLLASFNVSDGTGPYAGLISDVAGDLFGTTYYGGANNDGVAFELLKSSSGYSAPITLASFTGSNGANPYAGLLMDTAGDVFGTTENGGANNDGTVFELVKSGSGYSAPVTLVTFTSSNGANPKGGLISDAAGDLFGTTYMGGGTVFELVKSGSTYTPVTLASLNGASGYSPESGLIMDAAGDLFGTAYQGGADGQGTVFELVKSGSGYSAPIALASFHGSDGADPFGRPDQRRGW